MLVSTTHLLLRLPDGASHADLDRLERGNVNAVVLSVAAQVYPRTAQGHAQARAEAEEKRRAIDAAIRESDGRLVLALSAKDVRAVAATGGIAVLVGFQNAQHLAGSLDELDALYAEDIRIFDFTHASNDFADSSRSGIAEHGGLSPLGRQARCRPSSIILIMQSSGSASITWASVMISITAGALPGLKTSVRRAR